MYFEKENIYTLDSKGELLITIMSSLAQEESRSISENTTWGKRKQFAADFLTKKRKKNQGEIPQYYLHRFAGRFYYERLDERRKYNDYLLL